MNTANKLAQIAQANQHKQKDVDVYKTEKQFLQVAIQPLKPL